MTPFENDENTWQRLDYRILQSSPVALYWKVEIWNKHTDWFIKNEYKVFRFDAIDWPTEEAFHSGMKACLCFPDYYGMNLDAFNDCLSDLEFSDYAGIVVAIKNYHSFHAQFPRTAQIVLDIFADNSWTHLLFGNRLVALVQTETADASYDPVGARPVIWNPEEWFNSERGL